MTTRWPGHAFRRGGDVVALVRGHMAFAVVCAVGIAGRCVLLPLWHGQDFTVWTLASAATLRGINIYAHHPAYPGGPYAYFPLFLGIEVPLQWLSQRTGWSFVVLGKLPMVAADLAVAGLLYRALLRHRRSPRAAAVGSALFFLNPLVLYNSAYYGRFDSMACALLLAFTMRRQRVTPLSVREAFLYGIAVAAKTFPIFVLGAALRSARERWKMLIVVTTAVLLGLSLPYVLTPLPYLHDIAWYDAGKPPTGLSPWTALRPLASAGVAKGLSTLGLLVFVVGAILIARRVNDLTVAVTASLVLFLLCNKVVLEQYLIWPLPWLVVLAYRGDAPARRSGVVIAAYAAAGLLDCESYHPLGRNSIPIALALAALNCWYLRGLLRKPKHVPAAGPARATVSVESAAARPPADVRRGT